MAQAESSHDVGSGRAGIHELRADEVRWTCDPTRLGFQTTTELDPPDAMIGQERAEKSLDFGVDIKSRGFNIYAAGLPGTGRTSMILDRLRETARAQPTPDDWCYVYNFSDPHRPRALRLPAGRAPTLRRHMDELTETLRSDMGRAFDTDEFQNQRNDIAQSMQRDRRESLIVMEQRAKASGFALIQTPVGLSVTPLVDGEPMTPDQLSQLTPAEREKVDDVRSTLEDELARTMRQTRARERRARERIRELSCRVAGSVVRPLIEDMREEYAQVTAVLEYLDAVENHSTDNFEVFRDHDDDQDREGSASAPRGDPYLPYRVNVVVTHEPEGGAPLIREGHPTHPNLIGRVEQRSVLGALVTDFTMIQAGALHRANGGYLVLDVEDLLRAGPAYDSLKRSLRDRVIRIEGVAEELGIAVPARLDPEPVPLDLKVALVGPPHLYYLLYELDPDFGELFKVRAEFETEIELNDSNMQRYARFIAARCRDENLLPFDHTAVARIVEEGVRLAENRTKLSTRFGDISDIVREAEYWARKQGASLVDETAVWVSIDERTRRGNLVETKLRERIADGTILVDVDGRAVGQINGLSVVQLGGYEFGQSNRITVRVFSGRDGVISIDREAKLTGPIHDKGSMILAGFISGALGVDGPLTLSATIVFEQSYGGIEGDSASLAELLALLSAVSEFPLRQDIAVTGSVNQHGRIQAVGGVTPKVEGFFDLCRARGLTKRQGVVVPASNAQNLTLRWDVAAAIEAGDFHVYTAGTVAQAIELLTGRPAGQPDVRVQYPDDTVLGAAQARLHSFARHWHDGPPR